MIKCENACPRGKFDGCCHKCPDFHTCPDSCQDMMAVLLEAY